MKSFLAAIIACVLLSAFLGWVGFEFWDCLIASFFGCMIGIIVA